MATTKPRECPINDDEDGRRDLAIAAWPSIDENGTYSLIIGCVCCDGHRDANVFHSSRGSIPNHSLKKVEADHAMLGTHWLLRVEDAQQTRRVNMVAESEARTASRDQARFVDGGD